MMPRWLSRLFPETKAEEVKPIMAVIVEEPVKEEKKEPELVVGEPVRSLADSVLNTDDWDLDIDQAEFPHKSHFVLRHVVEELELRFSIEPISHRMSRSAYEVGYVCQAGWMTHDEKRFMNDVYIKFEEKQRRIAQEKRDVKMALERQRFMVLVKQ